LVSGFFGTREAIRVSIIVVGTVIFTPTEVAVAMVKEGTVGLVFA
jgi:hypothetical protein